MYYFLANLIFTNKDAILGLPSEVKTILLITLVLMIGTSIIKQAKKLLSFALIATIIYFALTYMGVI